MSEVFNVNPAAGTNTAQYSERDALDAVITSKDTLELSAARERTTAAIPPPAPEPTIQTSYDFEFFLI